MVAPRGDGSPLRYVSTRGATEPQAFADVLVSGLAPDGGLFVPDSVPRLSDDILAALAAPPGGASPRIEYADVAISVMWPYVAGSIERDVFEDAVRGAYSTFDSIEVVPVRALGDHLYLSEIFHGPTLAFKDIALQLVGRLFNAELGRRGQRVTVLGATSGDTGSAAIDGLANSPHVDVVILYPAGRVSDVQRRQMTTVAASNVYAVAVDGTFDDCQDLVKAAFADEEFRNAVGLSAVNSINWARVMAQIVYYVTSAIAVRRAGEMGRPSFVVPTGNFGNILAGWYAKHMGLDVDRLVIATNRNDILARTVASGEMTLGTVTPTTSPSMDIQVSSNFERLLFELYGRSGTRIAELMDEFRRAGTLRLAPDVVVELRSEFDAYMRTDEEAKATIRRYFDLDGYVLDPHSAIGVSVGAELVGTLDGPAICLGTAHPAKFAAAVDDATGVEPALPEFLSDLMEREERIYSAPNDLAAVEEFVHIAINASARSREDR